MVFNGFKVLALLSEKNLILFCITLIVMLKKPSFPVKTRFKNIPESQTMILGSQIFLFLGVWLEQIAGNSLYPLWDYGIVHLWNYKNSHSFCSLHRVLGDDRMWEQILDERVIEFPYLGP